jgi:hypothetical protein
METERNVVFGFVPILFLSHAANSTRVRVRAADTKAREKQPDDYGGRTPHVGL